MPANRSAPMSVSNRPCPFWSIVSVLQHIFKQQIRQGRKDYCEDGHDRQRELELPVVDRVENDGGGFHSVHQNRQNNRKQDQREQHFPHFGVYSNRREKSPHRRESQGAYQAYQNHVRYLAPDGEIEKNQGEDEDHDFRKEHEHAGDDQLSEVHE